MYSIQRGYDSGFGVEMTRAIAILTHVVDRKVIPEHYRRGWRKKL